MSDSGSKKSVARVVVRGFGVFFHRLAFGLGYVVLVSFTFFLLRDACLIVDSLVRHWSVTELARYPDESGLVFDEDATRDFDGDGVEDRFEVEIYQREPAFFKASSGIVRVMSGATGGEIFSHFVPVSFKCAAWVRDHNGDGLDDMIVEVRDEWIVYGFSGERE